MPDPQVDPSQIQGLPPGAVVKPVATQPIEGLPAGAVVKPLGEPTEQQANPENGQDKPPSDPQSSWITRLGHSYATGNGAMEGSNSEVRKRLMEIAKHPIDATTQFGKGVLDSQGELAVKAKHAWEAGDHTGAAAYALYYLMPGIGPTLAKSAEQASNKDYAGAFGTAGAAATQLALGKLAPGATPAELSAETSLTKPVSTGFKAAEEAVSKEKAAAVPTPKTTGPSVEDISKKSSGGVQAAGESVQKSAAESKDIKGKAVGAAKAAIEKKIPENGLPLKDSADRPLSVKTAANKVLSDTADTEQLAGAKDPDMADVRAMADHLAKGQNAKGEPLVATPENYSSVTRAFDSKIDALKAKQVAGKNSTALRHVYDLKSAYQDDYFNSLSEAGSPEEVAKLRDANKTYAQAVADLSKGPAKGLYKTSKPSTIIPSIVQGGATSQDVVESVLKHSTDEQKPVFRNDIDSEILRQSTLPDGTVDGVKAKKMFYKMGDTAKSVYGPELKDRYQWYESIAKQTEAKNKPTIGQQTARAGIKTGAAALGGTAGSTFGPVGAATGAAAGYAAGDVVADFVLGKSGAVKIGIYPTEKIVLSPAEAAAKRPLITKFLSAKSAGKPAAIAAAYSALKGEPTKNSGNL